MKGLADSNYIKKAKRIWHFIWKDDSIWSWLVNVLLAFILIKFIVYPGLGFLLSTSHPIVAVVSGSMEHNSGFQGWWEANKAWYSSYDIEKSDFESYRFKNGFNRGDIMVLKGKEIKSIDAGDVIVFRSHRPDPIIHRVVKKWEENGTYYVQTKGDNNNDSIKSQTLDETKIADEQIIGKALFRVPFLGYVKIWFVDLLKAIGVMR